MILLIHASKEDDMRLHVLQPHLLDQIIENTLQSKVKLRSIPAPSLSILY